MLRIQIKQWILYIQKFKTIYYIIFVYSRTTKKQLLLKLSWDLMFQTMYRIYNPRNDNSLYLSTSFITMNVLKLNNSIDCSMSNFVLSEQASSSEHYCNLTKVKIKLIGPICRNFLKLIYNNTMNINISKRQPLFLKYKYLTQSNLSNISRYAIQLRR